MKSLLLVLALSLFLATGEALRCHRCISNRGAGCRRSEEDCEPRRDACVAAKFLSPPRSQFQRCISMADCKILQISSLIDAQCCQEDLCNVYQLHAV